MNEFKAGFYTAVKCFEQYNNPNKGKKKILKNRKNPADPDEGKGIKKMNRMKDSRKSRTDGDKIFVRNLAV